MTTEITFVPRIDLNLPESRKEAIMNAYTPVYEQIQDLMPEYESITGSDVTVFTQKAAKDARVLRLKMVPLRGKDGLKGIHAQLKEGVNLEGKAIDTLERLPREFLMSCEEKLREIEEYAERQEAARIAELQETRGTILFGYGVEYPDTFLGEMTEDAWEAYFENKRKEYQAEQERLALQKIRAERMSATSKYELYIENYEAILWEKLTDKAFNKILQDGISAHENQLAETARLQREAQEEKIRTEAILKEQREKAEAAALAEKQAQDELNAIQMKLEAERLAQEQAAAIAQANARLEQQKLIQLRIDAENREKAAQKALEDSILEQKRLEQEKLDEEQRLKDAEEAKKLLLLQGSDSDKIKELANALDSIVASKCASERGIEVVNSFYVMQKKWVEGLRRVSSEMKE
jgi:hypothetical protein